MESTSAGPTISMQGESALLLDATGGIFDADVQRRIWAAADALRQVEGIVGAVPGMNNLLVSYDVLVTSPEAIESALSHCWASVAPGNIEGKHVDIPVVYGGPGGEDLASHAAHCGMSIEETVRRHSEPTYSVAAIGGMPGFPYLSGLDPTLARGRRAVPKMSVEKGSIIVGGAQAAIMPCTAPSGWHILGRSDVALFDPSREPPSLLRPGDTVRFTIAGIER